MDLEQQEGAGCEAAFAVAVFLLLLLPPDWPHVLVQLAFDALVLLLTRLDDFLVELFEFCRLPISFGSISSLQGVPIGLAHVIQHLI